MYFIKARQKQDILEFATVYEMGGIDACPPPLDPRLVHYNVSIIAIIV